MIVSKPHHYNLNTTWPKLSPSTFFNLICAKSLALHYQKCVVIDCRFALEDPTLGKQHYLQGHLPNARYADLDHHLSGPITPSTGRHPLPDFKKLGLQLGLWGIHNDTQIVVYDDMSGLFASRLWWLLRAIGHKKVAVLEGGLQAWEAERFSLESNRPEISPSRYKVMVNQRSWWEVDDLQRHLAANDCTLIDARAPERFNGEVEPIDTLAGHIPGAVNFLVTQNLDSKGCFLPAQTIRAHYLALIGDTPISKVVHSCGSGVFACLGILAMSYAGLEGSKLYPGSWSEWIRQPERGIATT